MDFDPAELDTLSREELILRARARGVERPEQMTRVELRDEIVRRSEPDLERQRRTRGWLGVARDLLASVVESGLNLPDAAASIRGDAQPHEFQGPPPVATVTLAEIYATQGHYEQALRMLDEVIEREPEHAVARSLRERIAEERDLGPGRRRKVVETKGDPILTPQAPPVAPRAEPTPEPVVAPPPVAAPEPVVAAPEPAPVPAPVAAPEPVVAAPEPVVAAPEPAVAAPEPVVAAPEPVVAASEPVVAAPEPVELAPALEPALLVLYTAGRVFVYWRVPTVSDRLRLRRVSVKPLPEGPEVVEEDFAITLHVGGIWLPRDAAATEVRAAVGELAGDVFSPLTVARVVGGSGFDPPGIDADPELEAEARLAAGL